MRAWFCFAPIQCSFSHEVIISRKQGVCLGAAQAAAKLRMRFCLSVIQCSLSRRRFYRRLQREVIISYTAFYCNFEIEVNQFYTKSLAVQQFNNIGVPNSRQSR